ncbi:hypothetical protein BDB01DRAFT_833371 [Pilobolus umbonatus]|nr:hypothetical protein BDB01DRAFT_833371 [Pilobolus umbonatus]
MLTVSRSLLFCPSRLLQPLFSWSFRVDRFYQLTLGILVLVMKKFLGFPAFSTFSLFPEELPIISNSSRSDILRECHMESTPFYIGSLSSSYNMISQTQCSLYK